MILIVIFDLPGPLLVPFPIILINRYEYPIGKKIMSDTSDVIFFEMLNIVVHSEKINSTFFVQRGMCYLILWKLETMTVTFFLFSSTRIYEVYIK